MPIDKTKITKETLENVAGGGESGCHHIPSKKIHAYGN